jgi:Kef-type K+ transport system membrane component KefB
MTEMISSIEFQISLLLFVALAGYLLASRINQSVVIGEILVGILVGPSFLGLIMYTDFVRSIAHLGAIILLFVVGLEFKLRDIMDIRYGIVAIFGVIVPWLSGYSLAKLFGFDSGAAIFVGTALSATSIAITANVLKEMGRLQTDTAKAIIGTAVINDVLSLLALSVAGGVASGTFSYLSASIIILKAVIFIVAGTLIGYALVCRCITMIDTTRMAQRYPEFAFIFAMAVAFSYAMAAELIGLSAIFGSFIAGVSLYGLHLRHSKHYKEGAEYLHIIFASIFFVSLGVLADFKALTPVIGFSIVLLIVAILSKVIACSIPAHLLGMRRKDSLILGFGVSPRGELAMSIALIGLNNNLIDQEVFVSLIMMSVLTTIIASAVLRNWFSEISS